MVDQRWWFAAILLNILSSVAFAYEYVVKIESSNSRLALVEARLEPDDSEIYMNDEGVHGLEKGWATFVEDLVVKNENGKTLEFEMAEYSRWLLSDYESGELSISYKVRLGHDQIDLEFGDNGAAYALPEGVMWAGRALFIAGKPEREIKVRFETPSNWIVTTPWSESGPSGKQFLVHSTHDLVNSAIFAGTHVQKDLTAGNVTLRVALAGPITIGMSTQITDLTNKYLNYYENRFKSSSHASMVLIAADRNYWGGEVMGRSISVSIGGEPPPGFNPLSALSHVIGHEIFHVFSLVRMEVPDDTLDLQWFNEGFGAEYATWTMRLRIGEISEQVFLDELVSQFQRYQAQLDGTLTLESAGAEKAEHYDMVYSGGLIAALALDFIIRSESQGARSLDDFWSHLLECFPRGGKELTTNRLITASAEIFGDETAVTLEQYFRTADEIPFFDNAALIGLEFNGEFLSVSEKATREQKLLWDGFLTN